MFVTKMIMVLSLNLRSIRAASIPVISGSIMSRNTISTLSLYSKKLVASQKRA